VKLSPFGNKKLRTSWVYRSRTSLWRVYPTGSDWIVGEERDIARKKASFFSLNRFTGRVAWSKALLEDWWVGVETVANDSLVLHGFATPDMPFHKGITAVDVVTGNRQWEHPELCFEGGTNNTIIGSRGSFGQKKYTSIDIKSGRILAEGQSSMDLAEETESLPHEILFPETTLNEDARTPLFIKHYLEHQKGSGIFSWIPTGFGAVVVYQDGHADESVGRLVVIGGSDNSEFYSDAISEGEGMFVPDSFLIQGGMLYYVRRKQELVAVNVMGLTADSKEGLS